MILNQFSIAHCYPSNSSLLSVSLQKLRQQCKQLSPGATEPKLGNHITLLPPFRAHPDEMRQFATGLTIARAFYSEGGGREVLGETQSIDFFSNIKTDVCIVKVLLPKDYHAMIEACRRQLSLFNKWVFPILGESFVPHICILEGPGLYGNLRPLLSELEKNIFVIRFPLSFPKIMMKMIEDGTTRWEEFDPKV